MAETFILYQSFLYRTFFSRALTKAIDIALSVQRIEDEVIEEILVQGGAVSPIVTIEPRRRKFHKAITVTMPLPERTAPLYNGGTTKRNLLTGDDTTTTASGGTTSLGSSAKTSMESVNKIGQGETDELEYGTFINHDEGTTAERII